MGTVNLLLIVLLPFAGALLPPLAGRLGRGAAAWAAAASRRWPCCCR